jgi:hypothetical protein
VETTTQNPATAPSHHGLCNKEGAPNGEASNCREATVVYKATCKICDCSYVGNSSRQCKTRQQEHVTSVVEYVNNDKITWASHSLRSRMGWSRMLSRRRSRRTARCGSRSFIPCRCWSVTIMFTADSAVSSLFLSSARLSFLAFQSSCPWWISVVAMSLAHFQCERRRWDRLNRSPWHCCPQHVVISPSIVRCTIHRIAKSERSNFT